MNEAIIRSTLCIFFLGTCVIHIGLLYDQLFVKYLDSCNQNMPSICHTYY